MKTDLKPDPKHYEKPVTLQYLPGTYLTNLHERTEMNRRDKTIHGTLFVQDLSVHLEGPGLDNELRVSGSHGFVVTRSLFTDDNKLWF